mmetsp:Transcript_4198/g.8928  ORF Transcript_4198/g.8928 Transcript_4198/m.8928 type:complete len:325 (-) Transcript_4198:714-1688(-)
MDDDSAARPLPPVLWARLSTLPTSQRMGRAVLLCALELKAATPTRENALPALLLEPLLPPSLWLALAATYEGKLKSHDENDEVGDSDEDNEGDDDGGASNSTSTPPPQSMPTRPSPRDSHPPILCPLPRLLLWRRRRSPPSVAFSFFCFLDSLLVFLFLPPAFFSCFLVCTFSSFALFVSRSSILAFLDFRAPFFSSSFFSPASLVELTEDAKKEEFDGVHLFRPPPLSSSSKVSVAASSSASFSSSVLLPTSLSSSPSSSSSSSSLPPPPPLGAEAAATNLEAEVATRTERQARRRERSKRGRFSSEATTPPSSSSPPLSSPS